MLVSLIGGIVVLTFHRIGARRDDHRGIGAVSGDSVVGWPSVIGSIGRELRDRHVDLVEQRLHLRGVAGLLIGHDVSRDVAAICIQRQVQLRDPLQDLTPCFSASRCPTP